MFKSLRTLASALFIDVPATLIAAFKRKPQDPGTNPLAYDEEVYIPRRPPKPEPFTGFRPVSKRR